MAMRILASSYRLFAPTSRIARLEALAKQINPTTSRARRKAHRLLSSLDPAVLDAFRITTAFENLFKVKLILGGYVIHRISRDTHTALEKRQRTAPIRVSEVKKLEGLSGHRGNSYSFASLTPHTIQWSTLVREPAYRRAVRLPDKLYKTLKDVNDKRNTLHFLSLEVSVYNAQVITDLRYIRACFNRFVVRQHNRLVKSLGFPRTLFVREIGA